MPRRKAKKNQTNVQTINMVRNDVQNKACNHFLCFSQNTCAPTAQIPRQVSQQWEVPKPWPPWHPATHPRSTSCVRCIHQHRAQQLGWKRGWCGAGSLKGGQPGPYGALIMGHLTNASAQHLLAWDFACAASSALETFIIIETRLIETHSIKTNWNSTAITKAVN